MHIALHRQTPLLRGAMSFSDVGEETARLLLESNARLNNALL